MTPPSLSATPGASLPIHRPLQQTFTWRQTRGPESWQRERSHMRFVVDKVGRPLNRFRNTREMVIAIRDAIRGHRVAMSRAGILHRDISVNNILIVDDPDDQGFFGGFIHDFDCSSMSRKAPASSLACSSRAGLTELFVGGEYNDELKERRGTFYFMAVMLSNGHKLHGVHHDLESFYWVLLWVVLRHTDHDHPDGQHACPNIFKLGRGWEAVLGSKMLWLASGARVKFGIKNNRPLTTLLKAFGDLCFRKGFGNCGDPLSYVQVLALFDKSLDSDEYKGQWPEDDSPLKYDPSDTRIKISSRKRKRKAKHARATKSDSETDMDDEGTDFELLDDIDQEDGPAPIMPPYYDEDAVELIVPSDYARFLEAEPSPAPYVRSTGTAPCDEASESFGEACEVEDMLELDESDDSPDDADQLQGPDSSSIQKARKRRRTTSASNASAISRNF